MNTTLGQFNPTAILFFFIFIAISLGITFWAAKHTTSTAHYYAAGGNISGFQNGLALATFSSLLLIYLSPTIQVTILQHASAPFPLKNPGLVSIPLAFAVGIIVSLLTTEHSSEAKFDEAEHRIHLGELME